METIVSHYRQIEACSLERISSVCGHIVTKCLTHGSTNVSIPAFSPKSQNLGQRRFPCHSLLGGEIQIIHCGDGARENCFIGLATDFRPGRPSDESCLRELPVDFLHRGRAKTHANRYEEMSLASPATERPGMRSTTRHTPSSPRGSSREGSVQQETPSDNHSDSTNHDLVEDRDARIVDSDSFTETSVEADENVYLEDDDLVTISGLHNGSPTIQYRGLTMSLQTTTTINVLGFTITVEGRRPAGRDTQNMR